MVASLVIYQVIELRGVPAGCPAVEVTVQLLPSSHDAVLREDPS